MAANSDGINSGERLAGKVLFCVGRPNRILDALCSCKAETEQDIARRTETASPVQPDESPRVSVLGYGMRAAACVLMWRISED